MSARKASSFSSWRRRSPDATRRSLKFAVKYGWRIASTEAAGVHFQEALEEGAGGSRSGKGGSKNGGSSNGGSSKREGRSMGGRETAAGSKHRLGWRYAHSKRPPQTAHEAKAPLQG